MGLVLVLDSLLFEHHFIQVSLVILQTLMRILLVEDECTVDLLVFIDSTHP